MAITRLNSLAIPAGTVEPADISYPLTNFSSTGIDDNATSTAITINSSEYVGIGTASPEVLTHLKSSDNTIFEIESTTATAYMKMVDSNTTGAGYIGYVTNDMTFWANNAERMRIDGVGNVGIGTDTVSLAAGYTTVNINGSSGGQIHFSDDDVKVADFTANTGNLFIQSDGVTSFRTGGFGSGDEAMRITSSGNVGIGKTNPVSLLDVGNTTNFIARLAPTGTNYFPEFRVVSFNSYGVPSRASIYLGTDEASETSVNNGTSFAYRMKVDGNSSGQSLQFIAKTRNNAGGAETERMRIDSSGNVGIGTASPSAVGSYKVLQIKGGSTANGGLIRLETSDGTSGVARFYAGSGSTVLESNTNTPLTFGTNATERMRIDTSGNVRIGTPLHSGGIQNLNLCDTAPEFVFKNNTVASNGDVLGKITALSCDASGVYDNRSGANIQFVAVGSTNTYFQPTAITFSTNSSSGSDFTAERMRISSSGNVGIGTTSPNWRLHVHNTQSNLVAGYFESQSSSTTEYGLLINLDNDPNDTTRYFLVGRGNNNQNTRFHVASNGNVTNTNNSYGSISDEKLKENIVDSGSQWDDIKALRVRKYSMKEDALDAPNKLGVIAQEVEAAGMQGLVIDSTDMDENNNDLGTITKTVNYSILYMKAVKALQEAMDRIETLETEVAALKGA